ncbi:ankyrin repeat-containing domain protein [Fusarium oxysporum]|nr:ankyrin repeat-containing domain protein [Fusarium oxysporum]
MEDEDNGSSTRSFCGSDCGPWIDDQLDLNSKDDPVAKRLHEIAQRLGVAHKHNDPGELLFLAIAKSKLDIVKELVEQFNVDVNERNGMGRTPLSQAVDAGHEETVEYLLSNKIIQVDAADEDGLTPLWRALKQFGSIKTSPIAASLIRRANINTPNNTGEYPLLWAIEYRVGPSTGRKYNSLQLGPPKKSVLSLLLDREDLDVNQIDSKGRSALFLAVKTQNQTVLEELLKREDIKVNSFDEDWRTPLSLASATCRPSTVETLLRHPEIEVCFVDKNGRTPLVWSIVNGRIKNMKHLLKIGNQAINIPDKGGRTPLSWAAEKGSLTTVELLLNRAGVDKDKKDNGGRTALSWAVENKTRGNETKNGFFTPRQENERIVELLIQTEGIDNNSEDKNGRTPFSWAATNADFSIVTYLISSGHIVIDRPDINGRTPLSWSAEYKRIDVVECLLSSKEVNANSKDSSQKTPLSWATCEGNQRVMKKLIKKDTDTLYTMVSEQPEQPKQVKLLLDAGYDACQLDPRGRAPLHFAVSAGNIESAKLLISYGPRSINMKDDGGSTLLGLAVTKSPVLAKMLVENGAETDNIQPSAWFHGNKESMGNIICVSKQGATQRLQYMTRDNFMEELAKPLPSDHPRTRLFLCKDSPPPWEHGSLLRFKKSPTDVNLRMDMELYSDPNSYQKSVRFLLETSFPGSFNPWYLKKAEDIDSGATTISCLAIQHSKSSPGPGSQSTDFLSTLENSKIPDDGAEFLIQFLNAVETRWTRLLRRAEKHIRERIRLDKEAPSLKHYQQSNKTTPGEDFIDELQSDVSNLYQLRDIIEDHVSKARRFVEKYCFPYNEGKGKQLAWDTIDQLELREFTRVSMAEARRSTALATSMRRLTWMTFIFLPVMLASTFMVLEPIRDERRCFER